MAEEAASFRAKVETQRVPAAFISRWQLLYLVDHGGNWLPRRELSGSYPRDDILYCLLLPFPTVVCAFYDHHFQREYKAINLLPIWWMPLRTVTYLQLITVKIKCAIRDYRLESRCTTWSGLHLSAEWKQRLSMSIVELTIYARSDPLLFNTYSQNGFGLFWKVP